MVIGKKIVEYHEQFHSPLKVVIPTPILMDQDDLALVKEVAILTGDATLCASLLGQEVREEMAKILAELDSMVEEGSKDPFVNALPSERDLEILYPLWVDPSHEEVEQAKKTIENAVFLGGCVGVLTFLQPAIRERLLALIVKMLEIRERGIAYLQQYEEALP
jgi:hypothetical protein